MTHLLLIFTAFVFLTEARASPPPIRIHNHARDFLEFWEKNQFLAEAERVQAFREKLVPTFSEFYDYKILKWKQAKKDPNSEIAAKLREFPLIESRFRLRSLHIEAEIQSAVASILESFDDFDTNIDVHIAHSLGEMDGGGRVINGKLVFIFGIDGIVKYHHGTNDTPFYQHELFHMYHSQHFSGFQIWSALWGEGLATYVSEQLSPGASLADLMLDVPSGLVEECQSKLPELSRRLEASLESDSPDTYERWFLMSTTDETYIPKRAGYYLGYLIARDVHQSSGLTLKELARLNPDQVLKLIKISLPKLTLTQLPKLSNAMH